MLKKYLPKIIISSIVTLLPIAFGLIMWDKLPEQVAVHFNMAGAADGYASRAVAVFATPAAMSCVNILCLLLTMLDPKRRNIEGKAFSMLIWLVPIISIATSGAVYAFAFDKKLNVSMILSIFIGIVFMVMGNYLPKCGQNYTLGLRTPWTLQDADTWKATHRFGGRLFMVMGALTILSSFFTSSVWALLVVMITGTTAIYAYSYFYYTKHADKKEEK